MKETKPTAWQRFTSSLDKAIEAISPAWGLRRAQRRAAYKMLSAYRGASRDRLRQNWTPNGGSADADLLNDLPSLRERSRDLNRNDAFASAITSTVTTNIIGTGLRAQCRLDREVLGLEEEAAHTFEKSAERVFRRWCPHADAGGRMDFYGIQSLVQRQILENGEVILLPLRLKDSWRPYALAYEVIEADRLETPWDKKTDPNIRDGVELGDRGEPVAYYIRTRHPGDVILGRAGTTVLGKWKRYPARNQFGQRNIFHLYHVKRPGQTRGEPFFAPVLAPFKDLADYMEAELVAARIAACFAAFVKKTNPYDAMVAATSETNTRAQRIQEFEPGMVAYLNPGEDITIANPGRANTSFEPYVLMMLRAIGAALGLPIELVLKDFSKTNYSSARAALLEARRFFKNYQQWIATNLCQPTWELLLEEAWLREELPPVQMFAGNMADEWFRCRWIAPGWGWVDPVKEVESSTKAIEGNVSTLADECASQGRDWEEVLEQRKREAEKIKELGLKVVAPEDAVAPGEEAPAEDKPEEYRAPQPIRPAY